MTRGEKIRALLENFITTDQNYGPKPGSETLEEARLREAREKVKTNSTGIPKKSLDEK